MTDASTLYFIGGSSRSGKSTLAKEIKLEKKADMLAGDAFRLMLRNQISNEQEPMLHWRNHLDLSSADSYVDFFCQHSATAIENMRQEAKALWRYYLGYIESIRKENDEALVIESVDVLPEFLSELKAPHKALFIVDTGLEQVNRILNNFRLDRHGWMRQRGFSEAHIDKWVVFSRKRSEYIKKQANIYKYPCIDLAETDFVVAQEKGRQYLM